MSRRNSVVRLLLLFFPRESESVDALFPCFGFLLYVPDCRTVELVFVKFLAGFLVVSAPISIPPLPVSHVQPFGVLKVTVWIARLLLVAELADRKQVQVRFVPRLFGSPIEVVKVKFEIGSAAKLTFPFVALENL